MAKESSLTTVTSPSVAVARGKGKRKRVKADAKAAAGTVERKGSAPGSMVDAAIAIVEAEKAAAMDTYVRERGSAWDEFFEFTNQVAEEQGTQVVSAVRDFYGLADIEEADNGIELLEEG